MEYTEKYYRSHREGVLRSAQSIVPLLLPLIHPKSVVDVGCGIGTWLSVFMEHGISDILGIDREYVPRDMLEIPEEKYLAFDMRNPLRVDRQFDLVITLEVAEHLPVDCAEPFVESLTRLGPVILFSAAIPFQGGTDHRNEQWPDYWETLFKMKGYYVLDPIRKHIWRNDNIDYWYRQNILMFVQKEHLQYNPLLQRERDACRISRISMVHPNLFLEMAMKFSEAMEKYRYYEMESQKRKEESEEHRKKAEQYVAEAERYKSEMQVHKEKAEFYIAEAERYKSEMQVHKEKAEFYIAEAEGYKRKADPRNMSLKEMVKTLPIVIGRTIRNKAKIHDEKA